MTTTNHTNQENNSVTTFTVRRMTGRRISKLSTILLLCVALLLTKSCGIVALSGEGSEGSGQDLGQAEAWSGESTTTEIQPSDEGSGWDTTLAPVETTEAPEETTEAPATTLSPEETTQPEEETTTGAAGEEETTTAAAGDEESSTEGSGNAETTAPPDQESSSSGSGDGETTTEAPESSSSGETTTEAPESSGSGETTTEAPEGSSPSSAPETTSSSSDATEEPTTVTEPESTSSSTSAPVTIAPTPPTFECQTAGLFPDINGDCQRYHNCLMNPVLHQLQDVPLTCPDVTVFSASLGRCVRDVAECLADTFVCPGVGRFAGHDDTYYYNCVASLQGGFHKFVVRCSSGQRFEATIGGCWRYDWTQVVPGQEAFEVTDLAAIKRELKLYKAEEKLRLKAQKQQEKLARKQQKLEEKAAKKAAKELAKQQAKAEKDKAKGQSIESPESEE